MSNKNWTPGPWIRTGERGEYIDARIGGGVLQEVCWCGDVEHGNRSANASLISAAPELYEALEVARTSMLDSGYPLSSASIMVIDAALAKSRGEK